MEPNTTIPIDINGADLLNLLNHAATREDLQRLSDKTDTKLSIAQENLQRLSDKTDSQFTTMREDLKHLSNKFEGSIQDLSHKTGASIHRLDITIENLSNKMNQNFINVKKELSKMLYFMIGSVSFPIVSGVFVYGAHLFLK